MSSQTSLRLRAASPPAPPRHSKTVLLAVTAAALVGLTLVMILVLVRRPPVGVALEEPGAAAG